MFCTEIVKLLIFSFGDALFPKDILAPAPIWHSRLTLVEPTKILGSNARSGFFWLFAYLFVISFLLQPWSLSSLTVGWGSPTGALLGEFDRQRAGIWSGCGVYRLY